MWTLAAMYFALFMIMVDNTIVQVALPSIQRKLHTSPETLLWTVDAYVLTFAVLILLGGKLGDRFGRKRMFLVGLAIFTLASAACAQATSDEQLVAFRAMRGSGAALLSPLSLRSRGGSAPALRMIGGLLLPPPGCWGWRRFRRTPPTARSGRTSSVSSAISSTIRSSRRASVPGRQSSPGRRGWRTNCSSGSPSSQPPGFRS